MTVSRINVVDEYGEIRFVIAGDAPDPIIRGERVTRSISPAGIIWHDEDGNESGGIGVAKFPDGTTKARIIAFDFTHQPTDAIHMGTYESEDGEEWKGGLTVYDRRPYTPGPVTSSQGKKRVFLGTDNQAAGLVIHDAQERERIKIGVNADGEAVIEILNENGEVVQRIPQ